MHRVLIPLLGEDGDAEALACVTHLPLGKGARVDAVYLHREAIDMIPLAGDGYGASMIQDILEKAESDITVRGRRARETFDAWASSDSAKGFEARFAETVGAPEVAAVRMGRVCDMIVMARPGADAGPDRQALIDAAVAESGRPVLLAPRVSTDTIGRHALVAWNGSAEAARAVAMTQAFLAHADSVTVLAVGESKRPGAEAEELVATLKANGVNATARTGVEGPSGVADTILGDANTLKADLIVVGAYSHSRMRERIFGGVTRDLIENEAWPVLMAG